LTHSPPLAAGRSRGLADHEGTIRDIVDSTGTVQEHRQYDTFGQIVSPANPTADFPQAFTGWPFDADTGLYNYRARWYDPAVGRFVSEDPSGFDGGDANLYRYAGNSPVIYVDPSGLCYEGLFGDGGISASDLAWGAFAVGAVGVGVLGGGIVLGGTAAAFGVAGMGAAFGGLAAGMQVYANSQVSGEAAGFSDYALGIGLGGGFGGAMPIGGALDLLGTVLGGGYERLCFGGDFFGEGMLWGGLAGSIAGAGLDGGMAFKLTAGGAGLGALIGWTGPGTSQAALHGAILGAAGGGMTAGIAQGFGRLAKSLNAADDFAEAAARSARTPRGTTAGGLHGFLADQSGELRIPGGQASKGSPAPPAKPLTGRPHGGPAHDAAIDSRIGQVQQDLPGVPIRKHQAQIDAKGQKISDFRPDAQWTDPRTGRRHYYEASSKTSKADPKRLRQHDFDAVIEVHNLDTGETSIYQPGDPIP